MKQKMIDYINFELELMGEFADFKIDQLHHTCNTPRKMLGCSIEFLRGNKPCINDVCSFIIKTWESMNYGAKDDNKKRFETVLRLIELVWRIEKDWKFLA